MQEGWSETRRPYYAAAIAHLLGSASSAGGGTSSAVWASRAGKGGPPGRVAEGGGELRR